MSYQNFINADGSIASNKLMGFAHARARSEMAAEQRAAKRFGHAAPKYAKVLAECLRYVWEQARLLSNYARGTNQPTFAKLAPSMQRAARLDGVSVEV